MDIPLPTSPLTVFSAIPTTTNTTTPTTSTATVTTTAAATSTTTTTTTLTTGLTAISTNNNTTSSNQATSSPVKDTTQSSSGNDITITITPIGIQVFGLPPFLMRKHTLFKRLFSHVAQRFSIDENELIFTFHDRICPNQCPSDIGLENGDTIICRKVSLKKKVSFDSKQINFYGFVNNIGSLYDNPQFSDISFILSDGSSLYAHKNILSSRCAKFKGMFQCEMLESNKKEFEVKDHKPAVFRKMIEYLYTDSLNEENIEMILQLIIIADEYILESLKTLCESKLILEINQNNVSSIFIQSDIYNCKNLKKASLDHILLNIKKLVSIKEFESNLIESPTLLYEIIKEMAPTYETINSSKKKREILEFNRE